MSFGPSISLELGGFSEEVSELLRRPLESDEYRNARLKAEREKIALLKGIAAQLGALDDQIAKVGESGESSTGGTGGAITPTPTPTEPTYTVRTPTASNQTEQSVEWDFPADTITVFFDSSIELAFRADGADEERYIPLTPDQSPATFSSVTGIHAAEVFYRLQDEAPETDLRIVVFE